MSNSLRFAHNFPLLHLLSLFPTPSTANTCSMMVASQTSYWTQPITVVVCYSTTWNGVSESEREWNKAWEREKKSTSRSDWETQGKEPVSVTGATTPLPQAKRLWVEWEIWLHSPNAHTHSYQTSFLSLVMKEIHNIKENCSRIHLPLRWVCMCYLRALKEEQRRFHSLKIELRTVSLLREMAGKM